jgi:methylated-DNA-protein-cysteine methyltransferase-like protein
MAAMKLRDLDALYPMEPEPFAVRVDRVVRAIPRGKTLSYGAVAAFAGRPGGARAVVRALHSLKGVPWWRVIRADGTIAEEIAVEQARRLRAEGVRVTGRRVPASARHTFGRKPALAKKKPARR